MSLSSSWLELDNIWSLSGQEEVLFYNKIHLLDVNKMDKNISFYEKLFFEAMICKPIYEAIFLLSWEAINQLEQRKGREEIDEKRVTLTKAAIHSIHSVL